MPNSQRLLELALKGLEADRVRIDSEIAEIRGQLRAGSPTIGRASDSVLRKRRKMTAAARKRISEGTKRRYAEMREPASRYCGRFRRAHKKDSVIEARIRRHGIRIRLSPAMRGSARMFEAIRSSDRVSNSRK